jgi:5-hydroxyisourate hydrolase
MMTGLTTHILDLTHGTPANGVTIELYIQGEGENQWKHLKTDVTNPDGRLNYPLLLKEEVKIGTYELVFHIGDYFNSKNLDLPNPLFLNIVPIRFSIATLESHYHIPLLISPYGYQTYRGS